MKRLNKFICCLFSALPHINIALAVSLLVLFVTDRYNRAMAFINNDIAKWMLAVLCVSVIASSVWQVIQQRQQSSQAGKDNSDGKDN